MLTKGINVFAILFLGFAIGYASHGFVQSKKNHFQDRNATPGQEKFFQRFSEQIGLNENQKTQILALLKNKRAKLDAIHESIKPQFDEIHESTRADIKALLTEEQAKKFETNFDRRRAKGPKVSTMRPPRLGDPAGFRGRGPARGEMNDFDANRPPPPPEF